MPKLPHFYLPDHGSPKSFTSPRSGRSKPVPPRDHNVHAANLSRSLRRALQEADIRLAAQDDTLARHSSGFYLEFELADLRTDALDKLENRQGKSHIELLSVREIAVPEQRLKATVFVPESRKDFFTRKLEKYQFEQTEKGRPKNEGLLNFLESITVADSSSLFTGRPESFPQDNVAIWWEIWLRKNTRDDFQRNADSLRIQVKDHCVVFVEREVVLAWATPTQLNRLIFATDSIAELRVSSDNPSVFMTMQGDEQGDWANALAAQVASPGIDSPAVCVLDSGTTLRHPLIQPALDPNDQQAYEPSWPVEDTSQNGHGGHGTEMSGLSLYGDLMEALPSAQRIALTHRLESVKILPDIGDNDPKLYGDITGASIAMAEIQAPERPRAICLAITSDNDRRPGEPTSWSAAIDQLAYDPDQPRLFAISAGNIRDPLQSADYLSANDLAVVENPAQAWNALTVGAYTEKVNITDPEYHDWRPVGAFGDLSPRSRTSLTFQPKWPIKPDVVFEGGNWGCAPGYDEIDHVDDLTLLTTFRRPEERAFTTTRDTSAATALAARMAAQIMAWHKEAGQRGPWPETVRALIVHSAEWTEAMLSHLPGSPTQRDWRTLLCRYGYGVPNLERALHSFSNNVSFVVERAFSPFFLDGSSVKTQDMILHRLPWPTTVLQQFSNEDVEMRVTLSYFVEPNPGERGWTRKHRYSSHGLRFAVKRAGENDQAFMLRINKAARDEDDLVDTNGDDGWIVGQRLRDRGSIHSDIWRGSAAELAAKHSVAIYPVGGWWKEKKHVGRYNRQVRYSLIISLRILSRVDVDLYTPIQATIQAPVVVAIEH